MNRFVQFARSLLPSDRTQLLFIAGLVCLTIAPRLGWRPSIDLASLVLEGAGQIPSGEIQQELATFVRYSIYTVIFAASAGFFTCCWPGRHPARRVSLLVVLPSFVGLCAISAKYISLLSPHSVLQRRFALGHGPVWIVTKLWMLGTGIRFCFIGLTLVAVFVLLLSRGKASLPISVLYENFEESEETEAWKGCKRSIWIFQGAPLLSGIPIGIATSLLFLIPPVTDSSWHYNVVEALRRIAVGLVLFGMAVWAIGKDNRRYIRQQMRFPNWRYAGLGLMIPTLPALLPSIVMYLFARADWAAHAFGSLEPPWLGDYFVLPEPWTVALFLAAFAEEVIFRGVLQRHFIERFGLWGGISFVAIIWSAFHFYSDSYRRFSDLEIVFSLFLRVLFCFILGFALSWITLRSKSLIPATIAHGVNNVFAYSKTGVMFPGRNWVYLGLLALLTYVLFRYWPVETTPSELPLRAAARATEPAV